MVSFCVTLINVHQFAIVLEKYRREISTVISNEVNAWAVVKYQFVNDVSSDFSCRIIRTSHFYCCNHLRKLIRDEEEVNVSFNRPDELSDYIDVN